MNKIYITLLLCFSSIALFSQEKIESSVTVNKDYEASLVHTSKSMLNISFPDSLSKFAVNFNYDVFDKPYQDLYEFTPMESFKLSHLGKQIYNPIMFAKIRVGTSMFSNVEPLGVLYINPKMPLGLDLSFFYKHDSMWGNLPKVSTDSDDIMTKQVLADDMINEMGFDLKYSWKEGELFTDFKYTNIFSTFYGSDVKLYDTHEALKDSLSHAVNKLDFSIGVRSTKSTTNSFYYNTTLDYSYAQEPRLGLYFGEEDMIRKQQEHSINLITKFGAIFRQKHLLYLGINSKNVFSNQASAPNLGTIELEPSYFFESNRIRLMAGLGLAVPYGQSKGVSYVYPKVEFRYEVAKNLLWTDVIIDGGNKINNYSSLIELNKWLIKDTPLKITGNQIRAKLALRGKLHDIFTYSLSGAYSLSSNSPMTVMNVDRFNVPTLVYKDINMINLSANIFLNMSYLNFYTKFKYNYFFNETVSMMPNLELNAELEYNYMKRIFVGINFKFRDSLKAYTSDFKTNFDVPFFCDLGLDFTYVINQEISMFLQIKNILNHQIIYVPNYIENGANFAAGICFRL